MVTFNHLVVCLTALVSVCIAHGGHAHLHRRSHLQVRQFSNGTETPVLPIGTGVTVAYPAEYTSTVTQTTIKLVTVTYTLGDGRVKTTTITKSEESVQTVAHVQSTVVVSPIIETFVPASVPPEVTVSPVQPKSTSTTTLVVTVPSGEATITISPDATIAPATTSVAACSVETVYVPQYVTLFSTVTVTTTPIAHPSTIPPYSNHTSVDTNTISYDSTSTTTLSVYTTVFVAPTSV